MILLCHEHMSSAHQLVGALIFSGVMVIGWAIGFGIYWWRTS